MPIESFVEYRDYPGWAGKVHNVRAHVLDRGWNHSPRVNGRLQLRMLPYSKTEEKVILFRDPTSLIIPTGFFISGQMGPGLADATRVAEQQSFTRLRGKLYKGNAALGVTIASYKQSREMIVKRYQTITSQIEDVYARAMRTKRAGRDTAGVVLEGLFGWQPLLADVVAAASTVIHQAPVSTYVSGFGRGYTQYETQSPNEWQGLTTIRGNGIVTHKRTAQVTVSNPNLWLAERAGTLNVAAIAWDLVPHSYIVNMFTNVGSLVNSITDFAGLSFTGGCQTLTTHYTNSYEKSSRDWGTSMCIFTKSEKLRTPGNAVQPPPWRLQFRIPDANWSLAAIAASVATQKISSLMTKFPINRRIATE